MITRINATINNILSDVIDLRRVIEIEPGLFELHRLSFENKMRLLLEDKVFFKDKIGLEKLTMRQRVIIFITPKYKSLKDLISIKTCDLVKLTDKEYYMFIDKNMELLDVNRFNRLGACYRKKLFLEHPGKITKNTSYKPKLAVYDFHHLLMNKKESFIDTFITDWDKISTAADLHIHMIKFNEEKYSVIFLDNLDKLLTATEVRRVFTEYPYLLKQLTEERMKKSKLTAKQWILFIRSLRMARPKEFIGWDFDNSIKEWMKLEATVELLSGKSKASVVFSNSLKDVK